MPAKVVINRAGIKCADPNCGKELPIGSNAVIYHGKGGRQYYGTDGCHEKKKMTPEEWKATKLKQRDFLIKKDDAQLDKLMLEVQTTTREEAMELIRKDDTGDIDPDDKEVLKKIYDKVSKHDNARLMAYAWPRLRGQALRSACHVTPPDEKAQASGKAEEELQPEDPDATLPKDNDPPIQ